MPVKEAILHLILNYLKGCCLSLKPYFYTPFLALAMESVDQDRCTDKKQNHDHGSEGAQERPGSIGRMNSIRGSQRCAFPFDKSRIHSVVSPRTPGFQHCLLFYVGK